MGGSDVPILTIEQQDIYLFFSFQKITKLGNNLNN